MKRVALFFVAISSLFLSACTGSIEEEILQKSPITEDESYLQYLADKDEGNITVDGYHMKAVDLNETPDKSNLAKSGILVSFAENQYLNIDYYADENFSQSIDIEDCYLNPLDRIYAKVVPANPNSNLYQLTEFRIYEYDNTGSKINESISTANPEGFVFEVPEEFNGEISILPIGEYSDRELSVEVFEIDADGNKKNLSGAGRLFVNGSEFVGNSTTISSVEPYVLSFAYDTENYFFVASNPELFTKNPSNSSYIEFDEVDPNVGNEQYEIELHKYLTLTMEFSEDASVKLNNGDAEIVDNGLFGTDEWISTSLKFGDEIIVETEGECTITSGDYRHINATRNELTEGKYRYTFNVKQEAHDAIASDLENVEGVEVIGKFEITLSSNAKYGECSYELDGDDVSGTIIATEGQELSLSYKITDDNYEFSDKEFLSFDSKQSVELEVTSSLHGTTINPDDEFDIVKKDG